MKIEFKKENIRFDICVYYEGVWNPHEYVEKFDFRDAIEKFQSLYLATGILPQYGDSFHATDVSIVPNNFYVEFYVIGRSFFIDDYHEIQILVVHEDYYHLLKYYYF
jgi:hypothetical protein